MFTIWCILTTFPCFHIDIYWTPLILKDTLAECDSLRLTMWTKSFWTNYWFIHGQTQFLDMCGSTQEVPWAVDTPPGRKHVGCGPKWRRPSLFILLHFPLLTWGLRALPGLLAGTMDPEMGEWVWVLSIIPGGWMSPAASASDLPDRCPLPSK